MAKLTDTQLIVLSKAARREDGAAGVPDRMNKTAAAKVGASLVVRRLMREIRCRPRSQDHRNQLERAPLLRIARWRGGVGCGRGGSRAGSGRYEGRPRVTVSAARRFVAAETNRSEAELNPSPSAPTKKSQTLEKRDPRLGREDRRKVAEVGRLKVSETLSAHTTPQNCGPFWRDGNQSGIPRREDSNLRMAESKSAALVRDVFSSRPMHLTESLFP
jgi:hypothetical protein